MEDHKKKSGSAPADIEGMSSEKQKALNAALAQIEKQFGKGSIMRLVTVILAKISKLYQLDRLVWILPWALVAWHEVESLKFMAQNHQVRQL